MSEIASNEFILLVENDREIYDLQQRILVINKETTQIQDTLSKLKKTIDHSTTTISDLKKKIDSISLDLKGIESEEAQKKRKFANASSPKEYYSLEQELERISKEKAVLDDRLILLWQELEEKKQIHDNLLLNFEKESKNLENQILENEKQLERTRVLLDQCNKRSVSYASSVDADLLKKYQSMKARSDRPVVEVKNGQCPICFYAVSDSVMQSLKQHKLVPCRDCYRLLYLKENVIA